MADFSYNTMSGPPASLLNVGGDSSVNSLAGAGFGQGLKMLGNLTSAFSAYNAQMASAETSLAMGELTAQAYEMSAQAARDMGKFNMNVVAVNAARSVDDLQKQAYYANSAARAQMGTGGTDIGSGSAMTVIKANNTAAGLMLSRLKQSAALQKEQYRYESELNYAINMNQAKTARYKGQADAALAEQQAEDNMFGSILGLVGSFL